MYLMTSTLRLVHNMCRRRHAYDFSHTHVCSMDLSMDKHTDTGAKQVDASKGGKLSSWHEWRACSLELPAANILDHGTVDASKEGSLNSRCECHA